MNPARGIPGFRHWIGRHPYACLFAFAFCLRLIWAFATRSSLPVDDAQWYWSAAGRLFRDHAYTDQGAPTAYWPVGYPFFAACFFPLGPWSGAGVILAQAIASSLTVLMIPALASGCVERPAQAWAAALAFAVFPSALSLSSLFLSETLFTFLLVAAFWIAFRLQGGKGAILSGLCLSAACYFRPVGLLSVPLLFGPLLSAGKPGPYLRRTGIVAGLVLITALPWAARNYHRFGGLCAYSTNLGVNLFMGHTEGANGGYIPSPIIDSLQRLYPNELELSHRLQALAVEYARTHPLQELRLAGLKLYQLLILERTDVYASFVTGPGRDFGFVARALAWGNNIGYGFLLGLFLAAPWWRKFRSQPPVFWLGAAFWIQIGFYLIFVAADRYQFPALPFLFMIAAARLPVPGRRSAH